MALKIKNLSKKFGEKTILDNFTFEFPEKGICIITGPSGGGKTTLLRIISGLDKDYSGTVDNGGISAVSFMFQEYRLFPTLSAIKNVLAVTNETYEDTKHATYLLTRLGFSNEDLKKKTKELSGGMKQRVAFARAVIKPSPILILDEPTKELDEVSIDLMSQIINEESPKRLIIVVTHTDIPKISKDAIYLAL